ncbi:MAG: hypothetical protein HY362_01815 [Candidatus Aenigmarchaeota archaeon]|nr:hypothetical protein [Candidatus Aenigmarchaeota archaeon]
MAIFTCPECGKIDKITIPDKSCLAFYKCKGCKKLISSKHGCILCEYTNVHCPLKCDTK